MSDLTPDKPKYRGDPNFSLRLNFADRARLKAAADGVPLGTYIRDQLLADTERPRRRSKASLIKDRKELAHVLAQLGQSRLASNVNQLAKAMNMGDLEVDPDTRDAFLQAASDIAAMRAALIAALGLQPEARP